MDTIYRHCYHDKSARDFKIIYAPDIIIDLKDYCIQKAVHTVTFSSFHDRGESMLEEIQRTVDHVFIWSDEKRRQLPTRRMMDCMHVMEIYLKVVIPIYDV